LQEEKEDDKKGNEQKEVGMRDEWNIRKKIWGIESLNETQQEYGDNFNVEANDNGKEMGIRKGEQEGRYGQKPQNDCIGL
jgi:hypothetical protein